MVFFQVTEMEVLFSKCCCRLELTSQRGWRGRQGEEEPGWGQAVTVAFLYYRKILRLMKGLIPGFLLNRMFHAF